VQNPNNPTEAFYYEVPEFFAAIEPTKTTSIRKKDLLTIVIHKKEHMSWPAITSQIMEADAEEEETVPDKSDTPVKDPPKVPRAAVDSREDLPRPKPTLHRSPERTKLDEERSSPGSAGRSKNSTEGNMPKKPYGLKPQKRGEAGGLNDPYFEEISKDFKDLRNSKQDPLTFQQGTSDVALY
jgi:hypothetical protein